MRSISIVGERRVGKSSLLRLFTVPEVLEKFGFQEEFVFCFNDLQGFEDIMPDQFWTWVLSELKTKVGIETLRQEVHSLLEKRDFDHASLRRLFEKFNSTKIVFILDEFETLLQNPNFTKSFYGHLRYLTQNCSVAFITATRRELVYHCIDNETKSSPFFNVFEPSISEWMAQYEKSTLIKALEKFEDKFEKVNPRYWDLLRKIIALARDPRSITEVLDKIGLSA